MSDAKPVSSWRLETAIATWQAARARLADDPDLAGDEAALSEILGPAEGNVETILARVLRGALHAEAMEDGAANAMKALTARRRRYEARAAALRATALAIMQVLDRRRHELPDMTANLNAPREGLHISDEAAIPAEYTDTYIETSIDRKRLLDDLKQGLVIPGASLADGLPTLTIRTR